jgi:hypothetical protein
VLESGSTDHGPSWTLILNNETWRSVVRIVWALQQRQLAWRIRVGRFNRCAQEARRAFPMVS